ncbi:ABC transporter permease [Paracoccus sp. (in: a-proteobacteria)]|uniref:ABC transporter permease n=1 Tax=Paracoccus sp. TaxID=267 RepID=UPI0026E09706|nr:ABC transporter permease [Paracoccus sp. (in: a-proteobacteria)]MDO5646872.1 ABC transporter permease [Paracoccus sp. (in: a-proteobacteria)]
MPDMLTQAKPGKGAAPKLRPVHRQRSYASFRAIGALILREMSTTYGKSAGGYLWAVAEPVAGIALLTVIFSMGFRSPPLGTNFAIFYATGMVPFMYYLTISAKVGNSINYSKKLLSYPAVTFMDALIARLALNIVTQLMVGYIVFAGIYLSMETRTDPQIIKIALSYLMGFSLAAGVGTLNCFLFAAFPSYQQIWSVAMRPLFIVSCIFFLFDNIPQPFRNWLWWNPLIHVIGQMRAAFYPQYAADYVSPLYVFALSLVLFTIGLAFLVRYHRDLLSS